MPREAAESPKRESLAWSDLSPVAHFYVGAVIASGLVVLGLAVPLTYQRLDLFVVLLIASCLTSMWKVNLPIPLVSGSTLSVSYAANLTSLLLIGPRHAVIIAAAGAWTQCTVSVKRRYPLYRTVFSTAAESITMVATGAMYEWLGGSHGAFDAAVLARPLVGAIATYFFVNTGLVAGAIALSTGRSVVAVWRDDFLWSGVSFFVAGGAGAAAAMVIDHGDLWKAVLLLAPVYLTYRTYRVFVGRLEDQKRHVAETRTLHRGALDALVQVRQAERALASEKERLAAALAEMTRLEDARNQLLEREQAARASAEQANRLKDQFLAIVSHELRTPLNAVLGWADMLRSGSLEDTKRDRAVHAIYDSARRQAQLIDELLDVSRIISGKLRLERAAVDWQEIVRAALEVVQPAAAAKRIEVSVDVHPDIGAFFGDGSRLQQIVWNLLTNAVKFTPEDGVLTVRVHRAASAVELIVADTGQGIDCDFLPSVFEPFRQADGSTTRRHGGLGLGLSIVKHLVEAHGGMITAESGGEGRGSTFTVRLPILAASAGESDPAEPGRRATDAEAAASVSLEGVCVLVVDDDDGSREVVAAYLESRLAAVVTAASAAEALDLLKRKRVDVLLADIAMPGLDGYELIRRVRAMSRVSRLPAAALTAFARDEDRQRALEAGFQMHLPKPIELRSLVEAVASLSRVSA